MTTLSSITNYRHHNIHVQRTKIAESIDFIQKLLRKQFLNKIIEIPTNTLRLELTKAQKLLEQTDKLIRESDQHVFRFGA